MVEWCDVYTCSHDHSIFIQFATIVSNFPTRLNKLLTTTFIILILRRYSVTFSNLHVFRLAEVMLAELCRILGKLETVHDALLFTAGQVLARPIILSSRFDHIVMRFIDKVLLGGESLNVL